MMTVTDMLDVGAGTGVGVGGRDGGNTGPGFAELLESYDYQRPRRGQIMEGVVLEASDDEVIVDVGLKRDAFVTSRDLDRLDDKVLGELVPGAAAMVYVLQPMNADGDLIVSVNKALEHEDWERARELMDNGEVIHVEVVGVNGGGLLVGFGRLRGFVPDSHIVGIPKCKARPSPAKSSRSPATVIV
jgi:small subunit ribosomal protein S1